MWVWVCVCVCVCVEGMVDVCEGVCVGGCGVGGCHMHMYLPLPLSPQHSSSMTEQRERFETLLEQQREVSVCTEYTNEVIQSCYCYCCCC